MTRKSTSKDQKAALESLSQFVKTDAVEMVLEGKGMTGPPKRGTITFVISQVKETPLETLLALQNDVVEAVMKHEGVVDSIISSVLIATFGFPFEKPIAAMELCERTSCYLLDLLKDDVRIVYGTEDGFFGNLGSTLRFNYGPIIPDITNKFQLLHGLPYGKSLRI